MDYSVKIELLTQYVIQVLLPRGSVRERLAGIIPIAKAAKLMLPIRTPVS